MPARLLMLSLDGLNCAQYTRLCRQVPSLASLERTHSTVELDTSPLTGAQAIWAELLTAEPWFTNGCAAYSRPASSLNERELATEQELSSGVRLIDGRRAIVINVPLLRPAADRLWLADGSMPGHLTVTPAELSHQRPFSNYKPRPFVCSALATSQLSSAVAACLQAEAVRLECARLLIKRQDWDVCLLRLNAFDLLGHMVGEDVIGHRDLICSEAIDLFLRELEAAVADVIDSVGIDSIAVVSAYSQRSCIAAVNLNQILLRQGACSFAASPTADETTRRRLAAAVQVMASDFTTELQQISSPTVDFDLEKTTAAAISDGGIYLNRADRFASGTVSADCVSATRERIYGILNEELARQFGDDFSLWKAAELDNTCPDLMVHIPGVELENGMNSAAVDRRNHPLQCHSAEGFAVLPGAIETPAAVLSPVSLSQSLLRWLEGK